VKKQVGEVAFGIDDDRGDALDGSLLQQADAQARLARAGHAGDDGMCGEICRVIEQGFIEQLAPLKVIQFPQKELVILADRHR